MQTAYNSYKNNAILTASPRELTLMLYNGAVKFCNQALVAMEKGNIQEANNNIIRVQNIVEEFRVTLDLEIPMSKELDRVYEYMLWSLVQGNIHKDTKKIEEVLNMLREYRDAWKKAMGSGAQEKAIV